MKKRIKMKNKEDFECCNNHKNYFCGNQTGGAVYGLGFIGAAIYYISTSNSFWMGVLGVLKAAVWPAFLVYDLLKFLAM